MKLGELWDVFVKTTDAVEETAGKVAGNLAGTEGVLGGGLVAQDKISSYTQIGSRLCDLAREKEPVSNIRLLFEVGEHFLRRRGAR